MFSISAAGTKKILYSFGSHANDGTNSIASLYNLSGKLYGTTAQGGRTNCGLACGTVFKLTVDGVENVIHAFGKGKDGSTPMASLIDIAGVLYGTTTYGGGGSCNGQSPGCGTVFKIEAP